MIHREKLLREGGEEGDGQVEESGKLCTAEMLAEDLKLLPASNCHKQLRQAIYGCVVHTYPARFPSLTSTWCVAPIPPDF